jgi:mannitol-1-phosphate/altronate dehydrogenase
MKPLKLVSVAVILMLISSCATKMHFPVSSIAPAADIVLTKKLDKNNNYGITLTAKNLAAVDRLAPNKSTYVLWIITTTGETKNAGQLNVKNASKATLKTITSFDFNEAFITAEEKGDVLYPAGMEITRVSPF